MAKDTTRKAVKITLIIAGSLLVLGVLIAIIVAAVTRSETVATDDTMQPLDYSQDENWFIKRTLGDNAKYDVIFFYGTSIIEPTQDNGVGDVSDVMKENAIGNFMTTGSQLTMKANAYVPAYRQMALNYSLSKYTVHEDIIRDMIEKEPYVDLKAAMDYYFTNINKDGERPFVLAGHSQGSAALQVVLDKYFINGGHKDLLKNMVAAYSIGYGVSENWFDSLDKTLNGQEILHFATGSNDYNSLISWNTEGAGEKDSNFLLANAGDKTLVINPLNWKTDDTYASTSENLGVLTENPKASDTSSSVLTPPYIITRDSASLCDAQIDTARGSVICSTKTDFVNIPPYGAIWGGKSLHLYDGKAFYVNMAQNVADRVENFLNNN